MRIILQPVAMLKPGKESNYEPSRISPPKEISEAEFLERYADWPKEIMVSGRRQTAYSFGLDCWYVVAGEVSE